MIEIFILAIALSMDAFAVSIGLGVKNRNIDWSYALKIALLFGFFQGFMPLVGYLAGVGVAQFIKEVDHWIAFFLLLFIGTKMIYDSFGEDIEDEIASISNKVLFTLAVATSIDALAAGFTLGLFATPILFSVILIGLVTMAFSYLGVYVGKKGGSFLESKAEFFGGSVLILIGIKILFEHLGIM